MNKTLKYAGDFELWFRFFKYDNLYVVDALIGGFRLRTANQLSLEGKSKYLEEVDNVLRAKKLTKREIIKTMRYKVVYNLIKYISIFFIRILNKYRKVECGMTQNIRFNRFTQQFEINEDKWKRLILCLLLYSSKPFISVHEKEYLFEFLNPINEAN